MRVEDSLKSRNTSIEEGADFDEKVGVITITQKQSWW